MVVQDIKKSTEVLVIDHKLGFQEKNETKKYGYWKGLLNEVDEDIPATYHIRNGISLLHVFIVLGYDDLAGEFLKKIEYKESLFNVDQDYHPLKIALKINDPKTLDVLAYTLGDTPCLDFNQELFFKALKSSSENFRKMISNSLFFHKELSIENLPTTAILNPEELPLCFLSEDTELVDSKLKELIRRFDEDGEPLTLRVSRSFQKMDWSFKSQLVLRFIEEYGKNAVKVIDNNTISLVRYLWRRYKTLAIIFSVIYFIFMITTIITIIWCFDTDSCEQFIDLGPMNLPFLIGVRVLMFSSYLVILFIEILSLLSRRL